MSVELVKHEILKFLDRDEPEVLCIRGKWGVGKTYTWAKGLEQAQEQGRIRLQRYSYVSLFGINSLDELKFSIFENVITLSEGVKKADLATLEAYVAKLGSWRKLTKIASSLPIVKNMLGTDATPLVSFMTIRDQIICIDDLERRGQKLDVRDVLGLISYLREQRNCKIALVLNDEQLDDDNKRNFQTNIEKVVDLLVVYEPTPEVSVNIAVRGTDPVSKEVANRCASLGITNIRVIKRILRYAVSVERILIDYDPDVLKGAIASITLFSWCHYQPEQAPSLEFLRSKTIGKLVWHRKDEVPPQEAAWSSLLEAYGYVWTDDFDLLLMEGVCNGYFDPERVKNAARTVNERVVASKANGSFHEAWQRYRESFDDNQNDVLNDIRESFLRSVQYVSPGSLNATISLFKELGRAEQAKDLLNYYMENRKEHRSFFDLELNFFNDSVDDADVREAFNARATEAEESLDIAAIMIAIKDVWNEDQLRALATAPVEEYRKVFKSHSGQDLRLILANLFQFDRIQNASNTMREIPERARKALKQIGSESKINALRVARFGVKIEAAAEADPAPVVSSRRAD